MKVYPKHPKALSEGTLKGDAVKNPQGEDLGKVEDFIIDPIAGRVAFVVASFGGISGLGGKLFAIPWDALALDTSQHSFILDMDKDRLKNAPGLDRNLLPSTSDTKWAEDIFNFYHQVPYWKI